MKDRPGRPAALIAAQFVDLLYCSMWLCLRSLGTAQTAQDTESQERTHHNVAASAPLAEACGEVQATQ